MTKTCIRWAEKGYLLFRPEQDKGEKNHANLNIQVEGLHQLLVDHGILGSKHTGSPNPTKAGEVMSIKSLFDRSFLSRSMSVLSDN